MTTRWTDAETSRLKALHAQGLTRAEIGSVLARSESAVVSCIKRLRKQGFDLDRRAGDLDDPAEQGSADTRAAFAVDAHLRDLQASGGRWATYVIPVERSRPYRSSAINHSPTGSAAAMCAEA